MNPEKMAEKSLKWTFSSENNNFLTSSSLYGEARHLLSCSIKLKR